MRLLFLYAVSILSLFQQAKGLAVPSPDGETTSMLQYVAVRCFLFAAHSSDLDGFVVGNSETSPSAQKRILYHRCPLHSLFRRCFHMSSDLDRRPRSIGG